MRKMIVLVAGIAAAVLAVFGVAAALGAPVVAAPERLVAAGGATATAIAVALLAADALLPVPSSLLLAYLGAAHGAPLGAAIGAAAHLAGGLAGFAIGRAAGGAIGRWLGDAERARVDAWLARYSLAGIAASRPLPVLAETVAIAAGTSRAVSWPAFALAAAAGTLPFAALNAAAGASARDGDLGLAVVAAAVVGAALWAASRHARRHAGGAT